MRHEPLAHRLLKAVFLSQPYWVGPEASIVDKPRIYFANHSSHLDALTLWLSLPYALRQHTRPVAAADYWSSGFRAILAKRLFKPILIERKAITVRHNPIQQILEGITPTESLILFPEGTRNMGDTTLLPFKPGLWHLGKARPDFEFVPTYLHNLNLMLPKDDLFYLPLTAQIYYGAPIRWTPDVTRQQFMDLCQSKILELHDHATRI
jgi:1-acyl-sn-glycerol-3-phosphate acyltransferase